MTLKKLSVFFVICFMFSLYTISVHADPIVSLNILDNYITVGESFDVEVYVDRNDVTDGFLAFGFDVFITGTAFGYDGYTIESGFDDNSFGANNVAGSVFESIADASVLIATLSFTGMEVDSGNLSILGLYDGMFSGLYYETPNFDLYGFDIDSSIDITVNPDSVPEPATILLLGSGLAGLIGYKRRSKIKQV